MHGDFRLDNLVVAEADSRVLCVLDWELATLGDPLADLATNCSAYLFPSKLAQLPGASHASILYIFVQCLHVRVHVRPLNVPVIVFETME